MPPAKRTSKAKAPAKRTARKATARKATAPRATTNGRGNVPAPPPPLVLTITETARELRLSDSTVRRLIREGELKSRKIGQQHRITRAELHRFLGLK